MERNSHSGNEYVRLAPDVPDVPDGWRHSNGGMAAVWD